jgi:hypothetical protein
VLANFDVNAVATDLYCDASGGSIMTIIDLNRKRKGKKCKDDNKKEKDYSCPVAIPSTSERVETQA